MAKAQGQRRKVTKVSISLSSEVLDWVLREKGDLKVSTFINMTLRDAMERKARPSCNLCEELAALRRRLKSLEEDVHELRQVRSLAAGKLGKEEHISILSTRPKDVFGELIHIKNVSAKNAEAVYEELVQFMQGREYIDRDVVLKELFPKTRSSITNNINYWYNACRGVLDHLIEEGFVVRIGKNRYKWAAERKPY
ncbi:hypothetical protein [Methanocella conradii]|uniref:hypothetical protein n=1 Tax=Methanocella conradii TaxID=1175444 RepID=UPI00157BE3BD|nr:hypothetical protein [Methanocella conradii]